MHRLIAILVAWVMASAAGAQQGPDPVFEVAPQQVAPIILTVDLESIFARSAFGSRIASEYNESRNQLALENRRISDALREEELALAAQRDEMVREVFQAEAASFDEKAQGIRRAQDAKERALDDALDRGQAQFLEVSRPILGQLMVERGGIAILDRRSVVLSLGSIDITEVAIERIDAAIGDGLTEPSEVPSETQD